MKEELALVSEVIQSPLQGYKLQMASGPHELVLSGPPVNVCKVIRLKAGVTWIPYLLQYYYAPLSALRRTAGVWTQGDTIRDETSGTFTTHYDGFGWYGTLKTLRAGRMYVVTSAEKGILTYAGEGECSEEAGAHRQSQTRGDEMVTARASLCSHRTN